jgi:transaldolase
VDHDVEAAEAVWQALAAVGVDLDDVAARLEREGVASFEKSFTELIDALEAKTAEFRAQS